MKRRDFIALAGAGVAFPSHLFAQQNRRTPRVGMLLASTVNDPELQARVGAFKEQFAKLGWNEGRNVQIEYRFAGTELDRLRLYAEELDGLAPDVIIAQSNPGLAAMLRTKSTIPIVFIQVADPVGSGFIQSLARPGGTVTGFSNFEPQTGSKWLELLREIAPRVTRAAVLMHMDTAANVAMFNAALNAGPTLAMQVIAAGANDASGLERAILDHARLPGGGMIALPHVVTAGNRELISRLAIENQLPTIGAFAFMARSGCLAAYGIDVIDLFRRSASYVDRILRGDKPSNLPVQAPTKYELAINLKTATALRIEVPPALLARADEVIE